MIKSLTNRPRSDNPVKTTLPEDCEKTVAIRKLLEAKDSVLQSLAADGKK